MYLNFQLNISTKKWMDEYSIFDEVHIKLNHHLSPSSQSVFLLMDKSGCHHPEL